MEFSATKPVFRNHPWFGYLLILPLIFFALLLAYSISPLLFHTLAEFFSVVVAFSLFMITWTSRQYIKNTYLLFVGIGYLFIGVFDMLHILSYPGMPGFFQDHDLSAQLWVCGRYLESLTMLLALGLLMTRWKVKAAWILMLFAVITAFLIPSVYVWGLMPTCHGDEAGVSLFKKSSELMICAIFLGNIILLRRNRDRFDKKVYSLLFGALMCSILAEFSYVVYIQAHDISNIASHFFRILAIFLMYEAIVKTGIETPYNLIFRELAASNVRLRHEIQVRVKAEDERELLIWELQNALLEVRTLRGILPICMHCKKIRDGSGGWTHVESYIRDHSNAKCSHGVCPECMKEHYGEYLGNGG
ncbi:hypothetical protein DSLASN_39930 [Desulfoluna limicola]|uniref:Membrane-associated sensor domain-containing protein n=1 Tax=Desulfoluna limicola TaxID=2810562 RepID=A0ABM7PLF3_9BACT|nr:MASE3 domain-containing protein [Desulfoluna limicola]BCS98361.1 hypothetical protein DSLASN_39930 [Desulfoluna limicola]